MLRGKHVTSEQLQQITESKHVLDPIMRNGQNKAIIVMDQNDSDPDGVTITAMLVTLFNKEGVNLNACGNRMDH